MKFTALILLSFFSICAHADPDCASWSDDQWTQYQSALSSRISDADDPCSLADDLQLMGKDCSEHFGSPVNFVRYCNRPTMDPDDFLARQDHPALEVPAEFSTGDVDDWKTYTTKFPYVEFDSNQGTHRVIFLDAQSAYDRWILAFGSILDIIVLDKSTDQPQVYFREYAGDSDNGWVRRTSGQEACYGCHISGVRQIIPATLTSNSGSQNLQPFNERLKSYGLAGYHGLLKQEDYGPSVGGSLPAQYACTNCHDGQTRGFLNELVSSDQYTIKMTMDKTMPANHPELTDDQRTQMMQNMLASYPQELKSWLEQF